MPSKTTFDPEKLAHLKTTLDGATVAYVPFSKDGKSKRYEILAQSHGHAANIFNAIRDIMPPAAPNAHGLDQFMRRNEHESLVSFTAPGDLKDVVKDLFAALGIKPENRRTSLLPQSVETGQPGTRR